MILRSTASVVASCCIAAACTQASPPAPEAPRATAPALVAALPGGGVAWRWPARTLAGPEHHADVSAPDACVVTAIDAAVGDVVRRGAPLLRLRCPGRLQLRADAKAAQAQLTLVRRRLERVQRLAAQGMVEASAAFALERDAAALEAELARSSAGLDAMLDPRCSGANDLGGDIVRCAAIDGVVRAIAARPGASVGPGDGALLTLAAPGPARIELRRLEAPPPLIGLTFVAAGVRLALQVQPLAASVDPASGTIASVHLPLQPTLLDAGLRGVVEVEVGGDEVVAVPADALAPRPAGTVVIDADGTEIAVDVLGGDEHHRWVRGPGLRAGRRVYARAPHATAEGGGEHAH